MTGPSRNPLPVSFLATLPASYGSPPPAARGTLGYSQPGVVLLIHLALFSLMVRRMQNRLIVCTKSSVSVHGAVYLAVAGVPAGAAQRCRSVESVTGRPRRECPIGSGRR